MKIYQNKSTVYNVIKTCCRAIYEILFLNCAFNQQSLKLKGRQKTEHYEFSYQKIDTDRMNFFQSESNAVKFISLRENDVTCVQLIEIGTMVCAEILN